MKCHIATHVGERTFGVLTKLDLMDKGTNALDVSFFFLIFVILPGNFLFWLISILIYS